MKKTLHLLMLLWAATLAACSADEPQTISVTEDYNREFVKEFGVPAAGHDFSMATTAGLKVTSKNGDHITVTAEIDGEEYLFADCHVPVGTTAIPVTIPRNVSELKLATTHGERTVATNALVNLDEIKTETTRLAAPQSADGNPYIAFKKSDFLKDFLINKQIKFSMSNYNYFERRSTGGYLFPIYWRRNGGHKDYKAQLSISPIKYTDRIRSSEIIFDNNQSADNPFPGIGLVSGELEIQDLDSDTQVYRSGDNYSEYPGAIYGLPDKYIIVSRGIRLEDFVNPEDLSPIDKWYLEIKYGFNEAGDYLLSSENPTRNIEFWNGNYFDVPLKNLNVAHHSTYNFPIDNNMFYIYDDRLEDGTQVGHFKEISRQKCSIIGFNIAPTMKAANSYYSPSYFDVLFLYIPNDYSYAGGSISTTKTYEWTIAAEDLGGTDDWDFNDVVFTFSDQIKDLNTENVQSSRNSRDWGPRDAEPVRIITVTPKAAGGTMPVYITYTGKVAKIPEIPDGSGETADIMYSKANKEIHDYIANLDWPEGTYIVGKEIHAWLGADSYKTMINTGEKKSYLNGKAVAFVIPADTDLGLEASGIYDSETNEYSTGSLIASSKNKTMCGFAVVVDKNNTLGIDAMNDTEQGMHKADNLVMGEGVYTIGRPNPDKGELAPQMILVAGRTWYWPQERVNISDAYPEFKSWLSDPASAPKWSSNYVKEKVTY